MRITRIAIALAMLLAPTGVVMGSQLHETGQAVESHTTFVEIVVNEDREDERRPGFAAVAGIVTCQPTSELDNAVMWFNDQLLLRHGRQGPDSSCLVDRNVTHVWATEDEAPDPRGNPSLRPTGDVFEFTDPNGQHWVVEEYVYHVVHAIREESTDVSVAGVSASVEGEAELRTVEFHTWVVELGHETLDPTIQDHYNFVNVVDMADLTFGPDGEERHTGESGQARDGRSHDADDPDEEHRLPHRHDTATVDLWVGEAPEPGPGEGEEGARSSVRVVLPEEANGPSGSVGPLTIESEG